MKAVRTLKTRRGIAERRLHRRLVARCDGGAKAEVAREQLRGILKLVRTLLPQAVINRAARLQLAFHLARCGAGNEGRSAAETTSIAPAKSSANWTVSRALRERKGRIGQ